MSPNEPKTPPVTRTLHPVDVVFENDPPPSAPTSRAVAFTPSEIEALKASVRRAASGESNAPAPRPSLPVRATLAAKDKSPWIALGIVLVEIIRAVLSSL